MKIDMHTHSLPVSRCAAFQPEEVVVYLKKAGMDAIVLTNHYYEYHLNAISNDTKVQIETYINTYDRARKAGEEIGLKVFFGAEVKINEGETQPEFLLYGFTEELMRTSFPLYSLSQKELFDFCNSNDILMYQSHPYRLEQGYQPANPQYMHGVEVYNGHYHFNPRFEETYDFAKKSDLMMSAGSDFHVSKQVDLVGMIVDDKIENAIDLKDFLKENNPVIFDKNGIMNEFKEKEQI